jgi:phosphoribosylaminoimidazolecarboxamide formyltransferase/IMP cyclohydrolase
VLERALISVFDKTGLDTFVPGLVEMGVEIVASGGTAAYIQELGLSVTHVDELTDVPELLGGRVKTLHPRIHAAILARRDFADDLAALDENAIRPFDLVCVNLYPFQQVAARKDVREEEAVEMIDIGGPAMLRAAAKNFLYVAPVCSAARYDSVLGELQDRRAHRRVRGFDRSVVRRPRDLPGAPPPLVREGLRPPVRRESPPARGLLRRGRRATPPALAR